LHKKCKIQYKWSQKYVEYDFIAYKGAFGFKKNEFFMNLKVWGMLWNYLGYNL